MIMKDVLVSSILSNTIVYVFTSYAKNVQKRMSKGERTLSLKYRNEVSAQ